MTRLFFIRHGETDWNVECRWQGQADVPLNAKGLEQAAQIAQGLRSHDLDAIYSSDLTRARQTAEILASAAGLPVFVDARLREIHLGEWEGLLVSEIDERFAKEFQRRYLHPLSVTPPGGETTRQVQERMISAIQEILASHPGEKVAVVSHGFAIAVTLASLQGIPIEKVRGLVPVNGEVQELEVTLPISIPAINRLLPRRDL
jgi:broad specificity phosphatase PhoE